MYVYIYKYSFRCLNNVGTALPGSDEAIMLELQAGFGLYGGADKGFSEFQDGFDVAGGAEILCQCEGLLEDSEDEGAAGTHADESIVRVGDELLALLAKERDEVLYCVDTIQEGRGHLCPFCPFRLLSRPGRVMDHTKASVLL